MSHKYKNIFSPLTVKNMTLNNRIVMMPMGTNYGEQNGEMSFLHINYYEQRAKGGTGLIIVENASVFSPQGSNGTSQLRIDHDSYLPRLYKLCERVHKYGTKIAIQINHAGASAMSSRTGMQPVSSSNIPSKAGGEIPRPLEKEEIYEIAKKYGEAAKRAQTAGFDAVEIHAGHSYLISQFLSPLYNNRTDEFGGSIENRTRFARLVIDEVRKNVGPNFPILLRLSADEFMEGGNTIDDCLEYLEYLNDEVDIYDVSAALNGSIQYQIDANYLKDGWRAYLSKAVKEKFGKPCITMGNIRNPQVAEDILERGDADLIGMGRGLIADPEWVNKVELGKEDELRKCISCNIGCAGNRIGINRPIRCTVNPSVNEDENYKKEKVKKQLEERKYQNITYDMMKRTKEELYRLEHSLTYYMLSIKKYLETQNQDEVYKIIDSYIERVSNVNIVIYTGNDLFDLSLTTHLSQMSSKVNMCIMISKDEFYNHIQFIEFVLSLLDLIESKDVSLLIKEDGFVKLIQISAEYDFIDENQVKEIVNRDYEFDCHYQMITDQNLHLLKIKIIEHFE